MPILEKRSKLVSKKSFNTKRCFRSVFRRALVFRLVGQRFPPLHILGRNAGVAKVNALVVLMRRQCRAWHRGQHGSNLIGATIGCKRRRNAPILVHAVDACIHVWPARFSQALQAGQLFQNNGGRHSPQFAAGCAARFAHVIIGHAHFFKKRKIFV